MDRREVLYTIAGVGLASVTGVGIHLYKNGYFDQNHSDEKDMNINNLITGQAEYIISTQDMDGDSATNPNYGGCNNVRPDGGYTWEVPRENAMAIFGLAEAALSTTRLK